MRQAHRFAGPGQPYEGLTVLRPKTAKRPGVDWSGRVRAVPDAINEPLRWKKPQRIFVNSMSDLFHEGLPDEAIDAIMGTIGACDDAAIGHVFQVLTKRAERMRAYMRERAYKAWNLRRLGPNAWPPRNLWLGVSTENQTTADERIPLLLETPAAVRFIS